MHLYLAIEPIEADDPCDPNPCGPNSNPPRNVGDRCQCTCLPEMIGSPPNCRPECTINADCPIDKACINRKCQDPCPGLCGVNAKCDVRNHNPICICIPGYIGDPFTQCYRPSSKCDTNWWHFETKWVYYSNSKTYWGHTTLQSFTMWYKCRVYREGTSSLM